MIYWNQIRVCGHYDGGFGDFLPPIHYKLYGVSFSKLPLELGGKRKSLEEKLES